MKSILFLLDYYLPNASANGICISKIAAELSTYDISVSLLVFGEQGDKEEEITDTGIRIYRCFHNEKTPESKIHSIAFYAKWLLPLKNPVTERKNITQRIIQKAQTIIETNKIDTLVCVHLPVESLIAGTILKKNNPKVRVIAYMLDSFSGGFIPRHLPESYLRRKKLIWENRLFDKYDEVILMEASRKHHDKFSINKAWYKNACYLDIPLLNINKDKNKIEKNKDFEKSECKIRISFCGLLNYPYRNIKYLIELAKRQSDKLQYIFAGQTNVPELMNRKNFEYFGLVPHEKVERILEDSDVLLNFGVIVPSAISGKIFEYMSYGKPIISTYSIDNEACIPYLNRYPLSLLLDERDPDLNAQSKLMEKFITDNAAKRVTYEEIERLFYNNTPKAFYEHLVDNEKDIEVLK